MSENCYLSVHNLETPPKRTIKKSNLVTNCRRKKHILLDSALHIQLPKLFIFTGSSSNLNARKGSNNLCHTSALLAIYLTNQKTNTFK